MKITLVTNKMFTNFKSHELVEKMMEKILSYNRRTLDAISSKCYFYYARVYELVGRLDQIRPLVIKRACFI